MTRFGTILAACANIAREAYDHDVKYPAAAVAYYAFVSVLPLAVLVLAVIGESLAAEIQQATPQFLTPEARQLMYEALTAASGRTGAALFAVVVIAWGATNVVISFQSAIERVERRKEGPMVEQVRDAVAILGSLTLAIVLAVLTSVSLAVLPSGVVYAVVGNMALLFTLTVAFLPMYYVPTREVTTVRGALPGAFVGALGWTILLALIQFYAANASQYAVYGVLSGIIIILTSLYVGAIVLMLGIIVNAMLASGTHFTR